MLKEKSIKKNAILNMVASVAGTACSILSLPYVTRMLQPENYGKVSYAQSFVGYFSLLAELGILSYAMRECAAVREKKEKYQQLASQLFTINVCAAVFSLILLHIILFLIPGLKEYSFLIRICSLTIVFDTIRVRWLYQSQEDYAYLSLQGLASHIIILVMIFLCVKDTTDYIKYTWILLLPAVVPGIMNFVRSRKYCRLGLSFSRELKTHLPPILMIFAANVSSGIYVGSDTVLLGYLDTAYAVGLYSVAVRIYETMKILLSAALNVTIPRFCYYYNNGHHKEFKRLLNKIVNVVFIICVPALIGLIILSEEIVELIFGRAYLSAVLALQLLSGALIFAVPSILLSQCVLISMKKERVIFKATIFGAILNVLLNLILIPRYAHNAAAFTTFVSEMVVFGIYLYETRNQWRGILNIKSLFQAIVSGILMGCIVMIVKNQIDHLIVVIVAAIFSGIFSYFGILFVFRNEFVCEYWSMLISRLIKKIKL